MDAQTALLGLLWYAVFLVSLVCHEAAHGLTGLRLGDPTAKSAGLVTLDPIPHMRRNVVGTIVVPVVSYILGGWIMGWASTPYDSQWADRYPKRSALMSLAGPLTNLALALLAAVTIHALYRTGTFYPPDTIDFSHVTAATDEGAFASLSTVLSIAFTLNLILFVFNLLPLPGFDGGTVLGLLLFREDARKVLRFMANPTFFFFSIMVAWVAFDYVFGPVQLRAVNLLYPGVTYH